MAELASKTTLGGAVGDTCGDNILRRVFADGVYGWIPVKIQEFHFSGQFLCDPNEINAWGVTGFVDTTNSQDVANSQATQRLWTAGGPKWPYPIQLLEFHAVFRENNAGVEAWGWALAKKPFLENSTAAAGATIINEVIDNGGVGPRDYGNTRPHSDTLDLSQLPESILLPNEMLNVGVDTPTAETNNRYIQTYSAYIRYHRVLY